MRFSAAGQQRGRGRGPNLQQSRLRLAALAAISALASIAIGLPAAPEARADAGSACTPTVTGSVVQVSPPPSLLPGAFTSDTQISFFPEQQSVLLSQSLSVDGAFPSSGTPAPIPAGTSIDSYFIHANSTGPDVHLSGSITVGTPVLGIIWSDSDLNASDYVGAPGTQYPGGINFRGLEDVPGDSVSLDPDGKTVSFTFFFSAAPYPGDEVRVITAPCTSSATPNCYGGQTTESIVSLPPASGLPAQATVPITNAAVLIFAGPTTIPLSSYRATIDWDDGTSSSADQILPLVIGGQQIGCTVFGSHTFNRAGHYITTVLLQVQSTAHPGLIGGLISASPPTTGAIPPVGVLTSDTGPQCTATVVDLAQSSDLAVPRLAKLFQAQQKRFNKNVVVTAAHCVANFSGFMFAPAFTGIAPRFSMDFSTGTVSEDTTSPWGSPFGGQPVGQSPYGVWGCSKAASSGPRCGLFGAGDADVFVPEQFTHSQDASYDYAFIRFNTLPANESLQQATGGQPILFDASPAVNFQLSNIGYDVDWADANRPIFTSGWFDLISPPEQNHFNCFVGTSGIQDEHCRYAYLASSAGPRGCGPSVDASVDLTTVGLLSETRPSILASPCNLGDYSSGSPFFQGNGAPVLIGVEKATIHAGATLDPLAASKGSPDGCCTKIITPLRADAALLALKAEGSG